MKFKSNPNSATVKITQTDTIRRRVQLDCSEPQLTDQSFKKSADVNNIMKQYQATGLLDEPKKAFARYLDNTQAVPLEEAYNQINEAKALFMQLPSSLRKQMDHNPANLESFISDPDNYDQLLKHGLITKQVETIPQELSDPAPQGAKPVEGN